MPEQTVVIAVLIADWERSPTYADRFYWSVLTEDQYDQLFLGDEEVLSEVEWLFNVEKPAYKDGHVVVAHFGDGTWDDHAFYLKIPLSVLEELENNGKCDLSGFVQYETVPKEGE